jgi:hypothetical protein
MSPRDHLYVEFDKKDKPYDGFVDFHINKNIIQLKEWAFVYKNFLNANIFNKYNDIINNLSEKDWNDPTPHGTYWDDKISPDVIESDLHKPILDFLSPNFWIFQNTSFVRLKEGQRSDLQVSDSFFAENRRRIIGHYKIGLYFGNFEGGEICFPDQSLRYKPEPNDLVIFKIHQNYDHYTDTVLKGTRYAYQDMAIYNPHYFMP